MPDLSIWPWVANALLLVALLVSVIWMIGPPAPCPRCGATKGCDCDPGLGAGED